MRFREVLLARAHHVAIVRIEIWWGIEEGRTLFNVRGQWVS